MPNVKSKIPAKYSVHFYSSCFFNKIIYKSYIYNHQSHEEFLRLYGGGIKKHDSVSLDPDTYIAVDTSGLPSEVDWRKEGWVGPVGNQVI